VRAFAREERSRAEDEGTLEDCPNELAELRGVLLREHAWRMEHGL
jgi:hypothetical protein